MTLRNMRWGLAMGLCAMLALAADQKDKPKPGQLVDSGSFGVFVKGQRVVTEKFTVEQTSNGSVIKAQLKETEGAAPIEQKSSLELTQTGELIRYDWSQSGGGSIVVVPNNEFLIEKIATSSSAKPAEQPFLMPSTSHILDNNFFIHREIMAWRYLGADCSQEAGAWKCRNSEEFGVLVPQDRISLRLRIEMVGKEKIAIHGAQKELLRLNLHGEQFDWALWVDDQDQFKLMRIAIPADNTEVVRD